MKTRNTGKAKGVNTRRGEQVYTDEEIILYLKELREKLNHIPTIDDIRADKEGISYRMFYVRGPGSYSGWIKKIFGEVKRDRTKISNIELAEYLRKFREEFGMNPTHDAMSKADGYPSGAVYSRRGGIAKFLEMAGLSINKVYQYDDGELLAALHALTEKIKKSPRPGDMVRVHKEDPNVWPCYDAYSSRNTWFNWLQRAKIVQVTPYKYTDEQLEEALKKAGEIFGRAPTSKEFDALKRFPPSFHYSRRGGWLTWLKRCGLQYEQPGNWFSKKITTKDGHIVRSAEEAQIDDWLADHGIFHFYEPSYPNQKQYKADFKIGDIYYEYCGLEKQFDGYDQRLQKKFKLAEDLGIKVVLIVRNDLNNLEKIFGIESD